MNEVEVINKVVIPKGYKLAEPLMRTLREGDLYLSISGSVNTATCKLSAKYVILEKVWEPEVGKYYMFSDLAHKQGTTNGKLEKLVEVRKNSTFRYASTEEAYTYCWPLKCDLGE